jgi:hypothetical protein
MHKSTFLQIFLTISGFPEGGPPPLFFGSFIPVTQIPWRWSFESHIWIWQLDQSLQQLMTVLER